MYTPNNGEPNRTIMQMEIHPELIRLRSERVARLMRQFQGCQNAGMSLGGLAAIFPSLIGQGACQNPFQPWRQQ